MRSVLVVLSMALMLYSLSLSVVSGSCQHRGDARCQQRKLALGQLCTWQGHGGDALGLCCMLHRLATGWCSDGSSVVARSRPLWGPGTRAVKPQDL